MRKPLLALTAVAAVAIALLGGGVAFAQDRKPVDIKAEKACGVVTLTFTNPTTTAHGFRWNAVAGNVATSDGARTGLVTVAAGATIKETIRFDEDEFSGTAAVTLAYAFGQDSDIQPTFPGVYPVDTDCDGKPAVTYPADCEIGAGVDNGESGKQTDADAPCISNSPGYEQDEAGKACDLTSGEPGRGDGIVSAALKCEDPNAAGNDDDQGNDNDADNDADTSAPRFATCVEASIALVYDIPRTSPDYRASMDTDNDGVACERPGAALNGGSQVPLVPVAIDTGRA